MLYTPLYWSLFIANLLTVASFGAFFLLPLFVVAHGGSKGDVGLTMGIFACASAFCRPWIAEMIDRYGRRRSYLVGGALMTFLPLCYLPLDGNLVDFIVPLLILRALHGIGLAICFTAVFTFVADVVPHSRLNEGVGIFGISGLIGMATGPFIAEIILRQYGFAAFFVAAALLAGVACCCIWPLPETKSPSAHLATQSFFELLRQPKQATVGALSLLFGFGLAASGNFVAPLALERNLALVSLFFVAYSCAAILVRILAGGRADRLGEKRILPWALLVFGTGLLSMIAVHTTGMLIGAGLIAGLGHGLLFPTLNAMAVRDQPFNMRGKATAIFTGGIDGGIFIGSLLLGYIAEFAGLNGLFAIAGGAFFIGWGILRQRQQPAFS
ncbi:MAG: MFS transporter [Desulfuromonadales bacterium]|nr:MFS transporter [Desulfuromonadales bacterium]MDT8423716.1 MFS transporter [Desulfuromonadales bacterium]